MKYLTVTVLLFFLFACATGDEPVSKRPYRDDMRKFVQSISRYAKSNNPEFIVIPQNGHELLTENGEIDGIPVKSYVDAIDGIGREDLYYGYSGDNRKTPANSHNYMLPFMKLAEELDIEVLVTDYCSTRSRIDNSYIQNNSHGFISFAADHRSLDNIPSYPVSPNNMNETDVYTLSDAKNFLYMINPVEFISKEMMLDDISKTNFDIVLIDLFDNNGVALTLNEINSIKRKSNGAKRVVIAYMSIGEAEDYRYYWNSLWETDTPAWMEEENPDWKGNYKVRYWDIDWQNIILGNKNAYLDKILDAGFDGVYLDIIDGYEYFE